MSNMWNIAKREKPDDDRKIICLTRARNGNLDMKIGYYMEESDRYVTMGVAEVIAWHELPDMPEEVK